MKKIISVLCSFLLAFCAFGVENINSRSRISWSMNKKIVRTLRESQKNVYDYNGDGLVNCIDYSCLFKLTWDKNFPNEKNRCSLIRNFNGKVMNHLFAQVFDENGNVIEVEPWAYNPNEYLMIENWAKQSYNRKFNHYGETERWLSQGKLAVRRK